MSSYFDQWSSSIVRPSYLADQRFGVGIDSSDYVSPLIIPLNAVYIGKGPGPNYSRQWRSHSGRSDKGSSVIANKNKYEISLDVQQFEPNEISVKVNGNNIIIEGNHEEKQDRHGSVSRHFIRKYWVPNGHNFNKISSSLSSDGILSVSVPRNDEENEDRVIPILHTGALAEGDNEDDRKCADDRRKEKRGKKLEKQDEKWEEKEEKQVDEKQEDDREEQKEEDEKKE